LGWKIEATPAAERQLRKLDRQTARRISQYLKALVADCSDPRQRGKALTANRVGLWRYRVGDYRVICDLQDGELLVLVLEIAHRREVYR